MPYAYFSHNGELLPSDQAVMPLSSVEYAYGFGAYENIRVVKGRALFVAEHCERLQYSAQIIGLEHDFSATFVQRSIKALLTANSVDTCNLKVLLVGGPAKASASLDILCLNPLFPDRTLYKTGAKTITYHSERLSPQAKTLNMLSSYLAYRQAAQTGAYDALLVDHEDNVREGTRTNFFGLKGRTITSPPVEKILSGVTRTHVIEVAEQRGFQIAERDISLPELTAFDALFLTSTSSKIMPISRVDEQTFDPTAVALQELMQAFDRFLQAQI